MKAFSLSKLTSIVSIVLVTLCGFEASAVPPVAPPQPTVSEGGYAEITRYQIGAEANNKCSEMQGKLTEAIKKAQTTCSATRSKLSKSGKPATWTCGDAIEECDEANSEELSFGLGEMFGLSSNVGDACRGLGDLTESEFRSQKREQERTVDQAQKDLEELQKDMVRTGKDHAEATSDIQRETNELLKSFSQNKRDKKEAEKKTATDNMQTQNSINAQIRQVENKLMEIQKLQMKLPMDRQLQVADYQAKLLQCSIDIRIKAAKMKGDRYIAGSLSRASLSGSSRGRELSDEYDVCVQKVLIQRTAEGEMYKAQVAQLEKAFLDTNAELKEAKAAKQLFEQQKFQAEQERLQNDQEDAANNLKAYNEMIRRQQAVDQQKSQALMNNITSMTRAQAKVTRDSNELNLYTQGKMPGTKRKSEAMDAIGEVSSAQTMCQQYCGNPCPITNGEFSGGVQFNRAKVIPVN